jgi:hypothetical protein
MASQAQVLRQTVDQLASIVSGSTDVPNGTHIASASKLKKKVLNAQSSSTATKSVEKKISSSETLNSF